MRYATGDANTSPLFGWSDRIPTGKDAGTYYIWYDVLGDENHRNADPAGPIEVTIGKKLITIVDGITAQNKAYDGTTNATLDYSGINWTACGMANENDGLWASATGTFA